MRKSLITWVGVLGAAACSTPVPANDAGVDAFTVTLDTGESAFDAFVPVDVQSSDDAVTPADAVSMDTGPPRCAWDAAWETHSLVSGLSSTAECEYGPFLFDDELSVIVPRGCGRLGLELFIATRATRVAPFTDFTVVPASRPDHNDRYPFLSADGLSLYWQRVPAGGTYYDPVVSQRGATAAGFTMEPIAVPGVWLTGNDGAPRVGPDGMYTHEERAAGHWDLVFSGPDGLGGYDNPAEIVELNSDYDDMVPVISGDGLTLWWSSNRPDHATVGNRDILVAHRPSLGDAWGTPHLAPTLSSADIDEPAWVSADGCRLYYVREGATEPATADVWLATRTP